jgi:outer membrane lipoprotein-sorting protein
MAVNDGTKRRGLLLGMLFPLFFMVGWADSWESVQRESANITSVSAAFSQKKVMQILSKPLVSKGHFYFQAPDSVRWEYTSPVRSILLMRRGDIKRYTLVDRGMVKDSGEALESMRIVLQEISRWTKGQFTGNDLFSATLKAGKERQIILTPKEKGISAMILRIVITLSSERPGVLKSVKIMEKEGDYTLFEFTDVRINEKIDEAMFREVG